MSYLVLARKSRPQAFAEIVGQKPVVRTLQNALAQNRVPHALIFSGVRGTGKTTLARIMAKALNCEQGPAMEPCNMCRSCREITDGSSIDLQEVDGASNRGIQEIRELKEKIRFMPTSSRFKIILIDEVHMLTTEAFNALLKTLEEPPEHVYFMFATTELHKVPVTILSRCQRYELKRLTHRELAAHFNKLAAMEGVEMEPEAVEMIVRESGGSVRDGLSLLDQIFSYCGQQVRGQDVIEMLGLVSHRLVADLGLALLQGDLAAVYRQLDALYRHGSDTRRLSNDLLAWFRALVICKVTRDPDQLLEVTDDELVLLTKTADHFSLETLTALFNLLLTNLEKVAFSQQPRLALELAFIRAVQFRDVVPVSELIARFDQMATEAPPLAPLQPVSAPPHEPRLTPEASPPQPIAPSIQPSPAPQDTAPTVVVREPNTATPQAAQYQVESTTSDLKPVAQVHQPATSGPTADQEPPAQNVPIPSTPQTPEQPNVVSKTDTVPETGKKRIRQHWEAFLKYVRERQPWIAASLQMAESLDRHGEVLTIRFADNADCTLLKQRNNRDALTEFVLDFFQENLRIHFEVPGSTSCALDATNGLAPLQERRALANDPLVLTALDVFTGQISEIRVGKSYKRSTPPSTQPTDQEEHSSAEE